MPLYGFECTECGDQQEILLSRGEQPLPCLSCGGELRRTMSAPASYRGLRTRPPGKTCCGRDERCDTPPCDTDGGCCPS
jgi:putative FmdB family regulatory protein